VTRRPDHLYAYGAMTAGALIAALTGSCTVWVGGSAFPDYLFSKTYEGSYALLFLWPSLLIGPACAAIGAVIFRSGHEALGSRRPDRIDLAASAITALAALAWCGAFIVMIVVSVRDILDPGPSGGGPIWEMALWIGGLVGAPAALAAYVALRAIRRLRAAGVRKTAEGVEP